MDELDSSLSTGTSVCISRSRIARGRETASGSFRTAVNGDGSADLECRSCEEHASSCASSGSCGATFSCFAFGEKFAEEGDLGFSVETDGTTAVAALENIF